MTEDQFIYLMAGLGFGFGSIFNFLILWLVFSERAK